MVIIVPLRLQLLLVLSTWQNLQLNALAHRPTSDSLWLPIRFIFIWNAMRLAFVSNIIFMLLKKTTHLLPHSSVSHCCCSWKNHLNVFFLCLQLGDEYTQLECIFHIETQACWRRKKILGRFFPCFIVLNKLLYRKFSVFGWTSIQLTDSSSSHHIDYCLFINRLLAPICI